MDKFIEKEDLGYSDYLYDEKEYLNRQINLNLDILIKFMGKGKRYSRYSKLITRRKYFAVYRLYRLGLQPREISYFYIYDDFRIRQIIGKVFKYLCLNDNKCVYRKVLRNG